MALRNIVQNGDPILEKVSRPVVNFDQRLAILLDDMQQTLVQAGGLGLAGPQVGILRRVFIALDERGLDACETDEQREEFYQKPPVFLECINPEIIKQSKETEEMYEGCLSFPGQEGRIARPKTLTLRAQDRTGAFFELEASGMLARCICHESNHLDGISILDLATELYNEQDDQEEQAE